MILEQFYSQYANTPIANRSVRLNEELETLANYFHDLQRLDEKLAPLWIEQREILLKAEKGFEALSNAVKF